MPHRHPEKRIATRFLAQSHGDQAKACQAILAEMQNLSLDSLDRYLLFNVGRWMLDNWLVNSEAASFEKQLTELMQALHDQEGRQPQRKPPEWETAADARESGPLHSKLGRKRDKKAG